jgi:hypothetical protein
MAALIVTLSITSAADKELRMHGPFDYEEFETDDYIESVEMLNTADTRIRIGDNWMYCWNDCKGLGPLVRYLWKLDDNDFNLNMLSDRLEEYGSLVL